MLLAIRSRKTVFVTSILLAVISHLSSAQTSDPSSCHLNDEDGYQEVRTPVLAPYPHDFSCLVTLPDIATQLSQLQPVDIRSSSESMNEFPNAWKMSVMALKQKRHLQNRQLLLLGNGFSRVQLAEDCYTLKKAGFTHTKFLIGGMDAWLRNHTARRSPRNARFVLQTPSVSATEVLREYFNGRVVILTPSQLVAQQLHTLGITHHIVMENNNTLPEAVVSKSHGGRHPIVFINDETSKNSALTDRTNNLYELEGGISALIETINRVSVVNAARSSKPRNLSCART
jgi:rhodanese-related sulfurtransferase